LHFLVKYTTLAPLKLPGKPGVLREVFFMSRLTSLKAVLTGFLLVAGLTTSLVQAKGPLYASAEATLPVANLPPEGSKVYALIHQGGPFQHEKDGVVFGNRERLLPTEIRGYYREYTVMTPGVRHRGTRRIVCGGKPTKPDTCYYTADHYASFRRIVP
jgi:ribonuclease T1